MEKLPTPPKPSRVTVPHRAHPAARLVFAEMARQGVTYEELEHRSGVLKTTFKAWRTHNAPGLDTLSAALGALGWEWLPIPPADVLKPEVWAQIVRLADQHGLDDEALLAQLVREVATRPLRLVGHVRGRPSARRRAAIPSSNAA